VAGLLAGVMVAPYSRAQSQSHVVAAPAFEVASVRISGPCPAPYTQCFSMSPAGAAEFRVSHASMDFLIGMSFGVLNYQIEGQPNWTGSTLYDISARAEGGGSMSNDQLKPLLQQLLAERFKLAVHREMKDSPGYALVVAKGGPKLQPSQEDSHSASILQDGIRAPNFTMGQFVALLFHPTGGPVVDQTGLTGHYNIKLSYAPQDSTDSALPSIFTAVQEQMGLKLESTKVPVQMLVIDHVEKVPTEN